jgi:5-methylcytosine-specific restriction endonuclease McrA
VKPFQHHNAIPKPGLRKKPKAKALLPDARKEWKKWRDKLDKVFSKFIRQRDGSRVYSLGNCISCGKYSKLQCGHFIKRQYMGTRWSEENCAGQCVHCNYALQGNDIEFAKGLQKRYFPGIIDKLKLIKQLHPKQPPINWLITMVEYYTKSIEGGANE